LTATIPTSSYSSESQIRIIEERIVISVKVHFMQTAAHTLLKCKGYEDLMRELELPPITNSIELRRNLKAQVVRITNRIFKYVPKGNSETVVL
jgi:hypothetical protein